MAAQPPVRLTVTFDVFSALVDSRRGGGAFLASLAAARGWPADGDAVYARWDALNKRAHRDCAGWVPFRELSAGALAAAYAELGLGGDPVADNDALLESVADWPLWPDVAAGVEAVAREARVGLLSNVDDDVLARTRVRHLPLDPAAVVTSERVRAYKPHPRLYAEAGRLLGRYVHVASSARDVRGSLEAGLPVVRLARPGHVLDPEGPVPAWSTDDAAELPGLVRRCADPPSPRQSPAAPV